MPLTPDNIPGYLSMAALLPVTLENYRSLSGMKALPFTHPDPDYPGAIVLSPEQRELIIDQQQVIISAGFGNLTDTEIRAYLAFEAAAGASWPGSERNGLFLLGGAGADDLQVDSRFMILALEGSDSITINGIQEHPAYLYAGEGVDQLHYSPELPENRNDVAIFDFSQGLGIYGNETLWHLAEFEHFTWNGNHTGLIIASETLQQIDISQGQVEIHGLEGHKNIQLSAPASVSLALTSQSQNQISEQLVSCFQGTDLIQSISLEQPASATANISVYRPVTVLEYNYVPPQIPHEYAHPGILLSDSVSVRSTAGRERWEFHDADDYGTLLNIQSGFPMTIAVRLGIREEYDGDEVELFDFTGDDASRLQVELNFPDVYGPYGRIDLFLKARNAEGMQQRLVAEELVTDFTESFQTPYELHLTLSMQADGQTIIYKNGVQFASGQLPVLSQQVRQNSRLVDTDYFDGFISELVMPARQLQQRMP